MEIITPLGEGGFGLVKLVKVKGIDDRAYALKCIQKTRVVQYGQQRHIMDEKNILSKIQSTFILALHKTFKGKTSDWMRSLSDWLAPSKSQLDWMRALSNQYQFVTLS